MSSMVREVVWYIKFLTNRKNGGRSKFEIWHRVVLTKKWLRFNTPLLNILRWQCYITSSTKMRKS